MAQNPSFNLQTPPTSTNTHILAHKPLALHSHYHIVLDKVFLNSKNKPHSTSLVSTDTTPKKKNAFDLFCAADHVNKSRDYKALVHIYPLYTLH